MSYLTISLCTRVKYAPELAVFCNRSRFWAFHPDFFRLTALKIGLSADLLKKLQLFIDETSTASKGNIIILY